MLRAAAFAPLAALVVAQDDVIMKGTKPGLPDMAYIFIVGAEITPQVYEPFFTVLQQTVPDYNVWVGAPQFLILNTPNPLELAGAVNRAVSKLEAAGLNIQTAKVVFGAHSLGGTMIQDWLANATASADYNGAALTLFGSYIQRSYRGADYSPTFKMPTLSVVGELDGLARVTRFAEAYWHQITRAGTGPAAASNFPVIMIPGANHFIYCSGAPPSFVAAFDLPAEISFAQGYAQVATAVSLFLSTALNGNATAAGALATLQQTSGDFFAPLVNALMLEGYYYFKPPCYHDNRTEKCWTGSPWSVNAQLSIAGFSTNSTPTAQVHDQFQKVSDTNPIHLPVIANNCSSPSGCVLNMSTVTENAYNALIDFDVALFPVTASEMRVKMSCRQNALVHAGYPVADEPFNVTDAGNMCAAINNDSYQWAQGNAAPKTLSRFLSKGTPLTFGEDRIVIAGPSWIWGALNYNNVTDPTTGRPAVQINSTVIKTPIDYWLPLSAGFHYCKLLSPARATEWIYVDSLRPILWTSEADWLAAAQHLVRLGAIEPELYARKLSELAGPEKQ